MDVLIPWDSGWCEKSVCVTVVSVLTFDQSEVADARVGAVHLGVLNVHTNLQTSYNIGVEFLKFRPMAILSHHQLVALHETESAEIIILNYSDCHKRVRLAQRPAELADPELDLFPHVSIEFVTCSLSLFIKSTLSRLRTK